MRFLLAGLLCFLTFGAQAQQSSIGPIAKVNGNGTNTTFWTANNSYVQITNSGAYDEILMNSPSTNRHYTLWNWDDFSYNGGFSALWNPWHTDEGGGSFAGEMQFAGAAIAFGLGQDSIAGAYKSYRRAQAGIGEYHHGWWDWQYDNNAKNDDPLGYSIANRYVTTWWQAAANVARYPAFRGEAYDAVGNFGVSFYGNYDTAVTGQPANTNMTGGTIVVKFRGGTTPGIELPTTSSLLAYGNVNIGTAADLAVTPSSHSVLVGYNGGSDPDFIVGNGGSGTANVRLRMGNSGNFVNYGGLSIGRASSPIFAETPLEVIGSIGVSAGIMQTNLSSSVAADLTMTASTTLVTSGLTTTVLNGHKYRFSAILFVSDSTAASGVKVAFDGGAATATDFRCHGLTGDTTLAAAILATEPTALSTSIGGGLGVTTATVLEVLGTFQASSSGTFIMRYAQFASGGTLTLRRGSSLVLTDIP